jgi:hypothetical protein
LKDYQPIALLEFVHIAIVFLMFFENF